MRILVVQESDWIERGPHHSHHLMERLSKRGHEIRVIDHEILWKEREKNGLISQRHVFVDVHKALNDGSVTVIRPPFIKMPVLDYVSLICTHYREIKRQIEEFQPDVVIGFGILNANIAIRLSREKDIPFLYYILDELHRLVPEKTFRDFAGYIESKNMENADIVISINEGLREYSIKMGAHKEKTYVVRAGVDLERFVSDGREMVREKYGILDDDIVLFFMGWLYDFSGLKEVALELAKCEKDNIKLMVVGKGDLWDTLQEIRSNYCMERKLITIDWVPYNDVPKYLSASDICILPAYKNEIMRNIVPIKMYEYMAAAKPVIASNLYGIMKEFGNDNGIFYVARPEDVLTRALELDGCFDEAGRRAKKFVENNNWDALTKYFENILSMSSGGKIGHIWKKDS